MKIITDICAKIKGFFTNFSCSSKSENQVAEKPVVKKSGKSTRGRKPKKNTR